MTLALVALVLCVAPSSSARQARGLGTETTAANVTLQVIVTGTERWRQRHGGQGSPRSEPDLPDPCDVSWTRDNGRSCIYSVPAGTDVTLQRLGSGNLVRWSVYECTGTGPCTVKMDASRTVVATFTPTRLALVVEGTGRPNASPAW